MKIKVFKLAKVKDLMNLLSLEEITFSRFVELLNEEVNNNREIKQLMDFEGRSRKLIN